MKSFILLSLFFINPFLSIEAQNSGYYYKYVFDKYILSKISKPDTYLKMIKEVVRYPAIARENEVEGQLNFVIINHGNNSSEVFLKRHGLKSTLKGFIEFYLPYPIFEKEIQKAFQGADSILFKENSEKFITEFSVLFKLEPTNTPSESEKNVDFIITGEKVIPVMDTSH